MVVEGRALLGEGVTCLNPDPRGAIRRSSRPRLATAGHSAPIASGEMDPKRLRMVHERMIGFGDPIHYSVFGCRLTTHGKVEMIASLIDTIDQEHDRIMIIDMGPAEGSVEERIEFLGVPPPRSPKRKFIIV